MRMDRIGGFEACTFVGVDEVVGNRIGPWREFFFKVVGVVCLLGCMSFGWMAFSLVCVCVCVVQASI